MVDWPCSVAIALTSGLGATVNPMRQPVIAYVFETPSTMSVWARTSGEMVAGWKNFAVAVDQRPVDVVGDDQTSFFDRQLRERPHASPRP